MKWGASASQSLYTSDRRDTGKGFEYEREKAEPEAFVVLLDVGKKL